MLFTPVATPATVRHDAYPLHAIDSTHRRASSGPRVAALQWLLEGHRPNVFRQVKGTYRGKPNGYFGARTKHAVLAYKYRIGYPQKGQCGAKHTLLQPVAGHDFLAILRGKPRSLCWVGLAAQRIKGTVVPGISPAAERLRLLELSQLGVHEIPDGSNRGPCISYSCRIGPNSYGPYQGSTGAYGLAWCASFADWALRSVTGHGFGSSNDAYTVAIVEHAAATKQVQAAPKVGSFVIFLDAYGHVKQLNSAYHIGTVVKVTASGVQTVEGNYANGVHEVWRDYASNNMVFITEGL